MKTIAKQAATYWLTWLGLGFFLLLGILDIAQTVQVKSESLMVPMEEFTESMTLQPIADTYVVFGRSNESREHAHIITVGYETDRDIFTLRTLLQFNLTTVPPNAEITAATLWLHSSDSTGPKNEMAVSIYKVTSPWAENITWLQHEKLTIDSTLIATTAVSATPTWHQWNVTPLVKSWMQNKLPPGYLGLIIKGDESPTQHQRAFWSKDCTDNICSGKQPYLAIQYNLPTPTPTVTPTPTITPTPTNTPTRTPTPTSTPGVAYLNLRSEPPGVITRGQTVTYFIDYGVVGYPDQDYQLTNVVITNVVPSALELMPKSLPTPSAKLVVTQTRANGATLLTWTFGEPLSDGAQGTLAYQAQRPTLTPTLVPTAPPTPGSLQIAKVGPAVATPNDFLLYTLVVTNTSNTLATNVIITDRIPANARYITGGELKDGVARFVIGDLAIGGQASHTLVVAATQTITNSDYGVRSDEGGVVMGTTPVVTYIGVNVTPPTPDGDSITHQGATIRWFYRDEKKEPLTSLPIFNPSFKAYLPVAARQD